MSCAFVDGEGRRKTLSSYLRLTSVIVKSVRVVWPRLEREFVAEVDRRDGVVREGESAR